MKTKIPSSSESELGSGSGSARGWLGVTDRQRAVLEYLGVREGRGEVSPSYREIGEALGIANVSAVAKHVKALRRKGWLTGAAGKARSLRVGMGAGMETGMGGGGEWRWRWRGGRREVVDIPVYGSIPAGVPGDREQMAEGCVSVDVESVGIRPTARTFALRVRGDSMVGKHIVDGDVVVIEHGKEPRPGDVVAALIDGQSTLKTFLVQRGRPFLRAENPRYGDLVPAAELVIQGVMVALIRKRG